MAYTRTGYANFAAFPATGSVNVIYVDLSNGNEYTWVTSAYVAYAGTLAGIRTAYQTSAWFSANGSILLGKGQRVDLEQTGLFKLGDGVTLLSALEFKSSATHKDTAWFTANAAIVIEDKRLIYCSDGANQGKYKIGDGATALSSLVFYGGISASGLTVGTTTITGGTSGRVMYNNAGVVGEYAVTGSGTTAVLSTSPTFVTSIFSPLVNGASTASGTLTLASTINATKGTIQIGTTDIVNIGNAVTTNQKIFRVGQGNINIDLGQFGSGFSGIWMTQLTPSTTNYTLVASATEAYLSAPSKVNFLINGAAYAGITTAGIAFSDSFNLTFGVTVGSKLGATNLQKIGIWGATPIVQPTTAVAAATIVNGAGTNALQDDTYDGYTVAKVVKALRNMGILA